MINYAAMIAENAMIRQSPASSDVNYCEIHLSLQVKGERG